jgi:hypothetical protein
MPTQGKTSPRHRPRGPSRCISGRSPGSDHYAPLVHRVLRPDHPNRQKTPQPKTKPSETQKLRPLKQHCNALTINIAPTTLKFLHRHTETGRCDHGRHLPTRCCRRRSDATCKTALSSRLAAIYNQSLPLKSTPHTPTHPRSKMFHSQTPASPHTTDTSVRLPRKVDYSGLLATNDIIPEPCKSTYKFPLPTPLPHPNATLTSHVTKLNRASPYAPLYPADRDN